MTEQSRPSDWQERQTALDISQSFIVQAPAGSGKTELLVQRILSLLAIVEAPEEILSITFTRKAAGEMSLRLLEALEQAKNDTPPLEDYAAETWRRARAVLSRDNEMGWRLLQNPSRLQLMTIDGFCAYLTRRMPWLARFGDQPAVTDQPVELYTEAAQELLSRLERGGDGQDAVEVLLTHLDNRMKLLRELVVVMLGRRDQWLRHLMAKREHQARSILESGLRQFVEAYLQHAYAIIGKDTYRRLWANAAYAAGNLADLQPDHPLATSLGDQENPESLRQWQALSQLVLTSAGNIRKSVNKTNGFPADSTTEAVEAKSRMLGLLESLRDNESAAEVLQGIADLPETEYTNDQWQVLDALIKLLPLAVMELQDVFRQHGQVDFIEIAGSAYAALGSTMNPEELLLQLDGRFSHILVDEFQDTSYAQYDLLRLLTAGWVPGDGRTLFAVGDPMQSIYRFREAEVGLYLRVSQRGLDSFPVERIRLDTNFRSGKPLVDWVNETFVELFPAHQDEVTGAVCFADSVAYDQAQFSGKPVSFCCYEGRQDALEAADVVELIKQTQGEEPNGTIAVLVRSRSHLAAIIPALKNAGIRYQAQDVDCLADRPVVQDILSLLRALLHPADRVAWLAVLRAPWCGLLLEDFVRLCGTNTRKTVWQLLVEPDEQVEMFEHVSRDGRQRLDRVVPVLERALANRGRLQLRRLVESTWLALGGPACVEEGDLLDAQQVFELLDEFNPDIVIAEFEARLKQLYAASDPQAGPGLQLMTIHKAKGLEFDTVILPGLGRGVRANDRTLLRWLEHPDYELLLAPIPPLTSDSSDATYGALGRLLKQKDDFETVRLLYVAVTRAKSRLCLLGHAKFNATDLLAPTPGSLLSILWPVCCDAFAAHLQRAQPSEEQGRSPVHLSRLPSQWQPPMLSSIRSLADDHAKIASIGAHYRDEGFKSRRADEGRVIGTLVHHWLEKIASDKLDVWHEEMIASKEQLFMQQLNMNGVPANRLETCASVIKTCLINTIRSERGRWLLADHREACCEMSLNGLIDGQLVRAAVDRTFVDGEVRWVVDYKTSSPGKGVSVQEFLHLETERYREQLRIYSVLVRQLYGGTRVSSALYFPAFDGWVELAP